MELFCFSTDRLTQNDGYFHAEINLTPFQDVRRVAKGELIFIGYVS